MSPFLERSTQQHHRVQSASAVVEFPSLLACIQFPWPRSPSGSLLPPACQPCWCTPSSPE